MMPNYVHATIAFKKTTKSINKIIGDGKRFIGYEIINRLKQNNSTDILQQLQNAVNRSDKNKGKLHEVWEDSFDWKECNSSEFIVQKLDYMHNNPFAGKWQLCVNAMGYLHSSAKFYITGEQGIYPVLNFRELDDLNLNRLPE